MSDYVTIKLLLSTFVVLKLLLSTRNLLNASFGNSNLHCASVIIDCDLMINDKNDERSATQQTFIVAIQMGK